MPNVEYEDDNKPSNHAYHAEVKILYGYIMFLQVQRDFGGKKWFYTSRAVDDERKRRVRFSDQRRTG